MIGDAEGQRVYEPTCRLIWKPAGEILAETRFHARIFGASNHYYSRVAPDFTELPTVAIISPYSTCAGGCLGCNRNVVGSWTPPPRDYVAELAADYDARGWDRGELVSVNITTGCQPDEGKELDMMLRLIPEYHRQGFSNASFFPFTYEIHSSAAMEQLREAGCLGSSGGWKRSTTPSGSGSGAARRDRSPSRCTSRSTAAPRPPGSRSSKPTTCWAPTAMRR